MMKRWMLLIALSLALAACGDADSKTKGKVVGGTGGGGTPSSNSDFSTNDGEFSGTAQQAIFGSGFVSDGETPYHVTMLVLNDTVDVCPLVPRSCEDGIPDFGEAQMSAVLAGPENLPVGQFEVYDEITEGMLSDGMQVAQVRIFGYDTEGSRVMESAYGGNLLLSTLTDSSARGEVSALFDEGRVTIDFDAEHCESMTWFIEQCL